MKLDIRHILPYLSALLIYLSYPPADLGFLAWVAYVPLFIYVIDLASRQDKVRLSFLHTFLAGFLFFIIGAFWIRHVSYLGIFVIAFILAFYWLVFAVIIRYAFRLRPALILLPMLWVVLEYVRSFLFTGFPWFFAGHSQYKWLTLIQITDITGVYGLSFLVLFINLTITAIILKRRYKILLISSIGVICVICGYGYIRLGSVQTTDGPSIGIVQGNIEQSLKINPNDPYEIYRKHIDLTADLIKNNSNKTDMIIWAETMFPYYIRTDYPVSMELLTGTAAACRTPMLIGAVSATFNKPDADIPLNTANSAYYIGPTGQILGRYDKAHLVPMGEYIPLRNIFPWIEDIILSFTRLPYAAEIVPGANFEPFTLGNHRFGVLICYESIFPELSRAFVRNGADFIVNVSNDGWFKDSSELEQILAISAFRAVETKRAFVRATNTGISAVISPTGRLNILKDKRGISKEVAY
ncbi:MAG: apolipoprotein N-acyltransferase [Planctomycetes bacterium]|nr:apolipoprotein N-acyltransferase [Planctomycetota bacterium]